jgi:hypothetical protein
MAGTDTVDNVLCYKIEVTSKDGDVRVVYFDSKTYYLVRVDDRGGLPMENWMYSFSVISKNYLRVLLLLQLWGLPKAPSITPI